MKKVIGIGNALVDVLVKIDSDDILTQFNLPKGGMQLVDTETSSKILDGLERYEKEIASGGSAANTINGLADLGVETAYIGKIGPDYFGTVFRNDLTAKQITDKLMESDVDTGKAVALVSPDSERTFATFLGAAIHLTADDLTSEIFEGYDILHIEGYLVQNHELIEAAVKLAKSAGLMVSLDLASFNVVEANLEFLQRIVKDYVDIVFANEEEAKSFTGKDPQEALEAISDMCSIAVVKIGAQGSMVKKDGVKYQAGAIKANPIDTTGAGDLYAAGFLAGYVQGKNMEICAKMGAIVAGNVIEVLGAKLSTTRWMYIKQAIEEL